MTLILSDEQIRQMRQMSEEQRLHHNVNQEPASRIGRQQKQKMSIILATLENNFNKEQLAANLR